VFSGTGINTNLAHNEEAGGRGRWSRKRKAPNPQAGFELKTSVISMRKFQLRFEWFDKYLSKKGIFAWLPGPDSNQRPTG
jgi:hypothetical protein